jgi:hypothetical protein
MEKIDITYKDFGLSESEYNFLVKHICENQSSVFIFGDVDSGKIKFSNLLIKKFKEDELITVVGDTHDYIFHENQKVSEIVIKNDDDYKFLMRTNPDRILFPELRGNVELLFKLLDSGYKGIISTMTYSSRVNNTKEDNSFIPSPPEYVKNAIIPNVDFLIYLKKENGKKLVDFVVINNPLIQKEAEELEIFDFKKETEKQFKLEEIEVKEAIETAFKKQGYDVNVQINVEQDKIINDLRRKNKELRRILGLFILGGTIYLGLKLVILSYSWFLLFNQ